MQNTQFEAGRIRRWLAVGVAMLGILAGTLTAAPVLQFSSASYTVNEGPTGGGFISVPVLLLSGDTNVVTVVCETSGLGTNRFVPTTNTLTFNPGDLTNLFTVLINDNALVDGNGLFTVTLSGATGGATLGSPALATVIITDDESPANSPPANDNFTNAQNIAGLSGLFSLTNTFATKETGEPIHAGNPGGASVWFRWPAPASGPVTFSTAGSAFDTLLAAYTGSAVGGLSPVASDNDSGPGVTSQLTFTAVAGQVYYIAVDGFNGAAAGYTLTWGNAGSAGTFGFTSFNFQMSEREASGVNPSQTINETYTTGGRITITRFNGQTGKVRVFYRVSNNTAIRPAEWTLSGGGVETPTSMTNSLVFFDGQTAASFFIAPSLSTNNDLAPRFVSLQVTAVQLEPGESPSILAPTIDPGTGSAFASILDAQTGAYLEHLRMRTSEGVGTATIRVFRGIAANAGNQFTLTANRVNVAPSNADLDASSDHATAADATFFATAFSFPATTPDFVDVDIDIINDTLVEFDEDIAITIRGSGGNPAVMSDVTDGTLTIEFNGNVSQEHPAGSVDPAWNRDYFLGSNPPDNAAPGANGPVQAVAVQSDLKTLIGGDFTAVNTTGRNRIARMNADGSLDSTFNVGTGANGSVNSIVALTNGQVVIGGAFSSYAGTLRGGVARLSTNAVLDAGFNPGTGAAGGAVRVVAVYTNGADAGKVLVAGDFTSFAGSNLRRLARLNANGSIDPQFSPGLGPNGAINALLLQANGKMLIGGDFTTFNGVARNRLARLNSDGTLDDTFNPGAGANGTVHALAFDRSGQTLTSTRAASGGPQEDRFMVDTGSTSGTITLDYQFYSIPDTVHVYYDGVRIYDSGVTNGGASVALPYGPGVGTTVEIVVNEGGSPDPGTVWDYSVTIQPNGGVLRYLVGGAFTTMDFTGRNRLARLNPDGSLDSTFDPGFGADDTIYSIAGSSAGPAYIGGLFYSYNGTRRVGLARVQTDGTLDTSFMDQAYNQFAGVMITNSPFSQPKNSVRAMAVHTDGGLMIGGSFRQVGGGGRNTAASGPNSPWGPNVNTPLVVTRDDIRNRSNIARVVGGATAGPGNIGFTTDNYTADEGAGARFITVTRVNGSLGGAAALFATGDRPAGPGTAASSVDYTAVTSLLNWPRQFTIPASSAYSGPNNTTATSLDNISVTVLPDAILEGEERINLALDLPQSTFFDLGGQFIPTGVALGRSRATLTILDDDPEPAYVTFATNSFTVDENAGTATITVVRSGGTDSTVTLDFATADGTATNGLDYGGVFGPLNFAAGETVRTFTVPINNDIAAELDETILLRMTNLVGAAFLPGGNFATLTIRDNDFANGQLRFSQTNYNVAETAGPAQVVVQRTGGSLGAITAQVVTRDGAAQAGADYTAVTNVLNWASGDSSERAVNIPLAADGLVEGPQAFTVALTNAFVVSSSNAVSLAVSNATVTILDSDSYGSLRFAAAGFTVNENGGKAIITVTRVGGSSQTVQVNYTTGDGTATAGVDYTSVSGTLTFAPGVTSTNFVVPILDNPGQNAGPDFNRTVVLGLNTFVNGAPAAPVTAILTIVDDENVNAPAGSVDTTYNASAGADNFIYALALQPDGQLLIGGDFTVFNNFGRRRLARLDANGNLDPVFLPLGGANDSVRSLTVQPDSRIIVGGFFTNVAGTARNRIARLNNDGSTDSSFDPGAGTDGPVFATALHSDAANFGRVIVAGSFAAMNGVPRPFVARLNTNGSVDATFNPGLGPDGTVYAALVQPDGKVVIGGDFTNVNGLPTPKLARLNPDGSLDTAFVAGLGSGFDGSVRALALQSDGRVLVGGLFTNFNGGSVGRLARVNASGMPDTGFAPNTVSAAGGDNAVLGLAVQPDGKIIVVGDFSIFSGVTRSRITRLKEDGTVDPTINFGLGANNFAAATVVQLTDGKIIAAGGFTQFDGLQRNYLVRLHGGVIDGPGKMEFSSAVYTATEGQTNAVITVRRTGGLNTDVTVDVFTSDGTALSTQDYGAFSNTLAFVNGEVTRTFTVPITNDTAVEGNEFLNLTLTTNLASGVTLGNQPVATLTLVDDDSLVAFAAANFTVNEAVSSGTVPTVIYRTGGTNSTFTVQLVTSNGTATALADYTALTNTLIFQPGETSKVVNIQILDDALPEGDETFTARLFNAVGPVTLGGPSVATVTIVDNDFFPGQFTFASAGVFTVDENGTNAVVTVLRTNGSSGNVTVNFTTSDGTASAGVDYAPTNGALTFTDGQTSKTFTVRIFSDTFIETNETVFLTLSNALGGATIVGPNPATLTIINNNEFIFGSFRLQTNAFTTTEGVGSATITVIRTGGTTGTNRVDFATGNGTAVAGLDYEATNGTLVFAPGETSKFFTVPVFSDGLVETNETVILTLSKPVGGASLGQPSIGTLTITNTNSLPGSFAFETNNFVFVENAGAATITVLRTNGFTGPVSVNVRLVQSTAQALVDYAVSNNYLTNLSWASGDTTPKSFQVQLIDDPLVEAPETVSLSLETATGGALISTTNATLTITDNEIPAGSVDTGFGAGANGTVYGLALRPSDNRVSVGGDFTMLGGLARTNLGRVDAAGLADAFDPGLILRNGTTNTTIRAVAVYTNGPHAGKVVAAGLFDSVAGLPRVNIVRFNADGTVDGSFDPGVGPDGIIHAIVVQDDGSVFIGGGFTTVATNTRNFVAKLTGTGSLDNSFNTAGGPNDTVRALAVQGDGKVVIGGDFTTVGAATNRHVARLTSAGASDGAFAFNLGSGADASVFALALQTDGKILFGGAFSNVNGVAAGRLARLNSDGTRDTSGYNQLGAGFDGTVLALAVQPLDNKVIAGGSFTALNGILQNRISRLNTNGSLDLSINFGSGANNFVDAIVFQPADGKIVIGGGFTGFNGTTANYLARLNGGENLGSGVMEFLSSGFSVNEAGTNALITVVRIGGASNTVSVSFVSSDITAQAGLDYQATNATLTFLPGETFKTFLVPITNDTLVEVPDETFRLNLSAVSGGATLGAVTNSTVTILGDDGVVSFASAFYPVGEQVGTAVITLVRSGGSASTVTVGYATSNGTATAGADYFDTSGSVTFLPGEVLKTFPVTILQDGIIEGNETVALMLTNITGPATLGLSNATLTIVDDDSGPGSIAFSTDAFTVVEGQPMAAITLLRANGSSGVVSVQLNVGDGTAIEGQDYTNATSSVAFADGEVIRTVFIPIVNDLLVEGDETVLLSLGAPLVGASIGTPSTATLTILDDDSFVQFATNSFTVVEDSGLAIVTVARLGNTNTTVSVNYNTASGTATSGTDFVAASGLLIFDPGVTSQVFTVTIVPDVLFEGAESFFVQLSNPTNVAIGTNSPAQVVIIDDDSVIGFATANFVVNETATNAVITLVRTGNLNGTASVSVVVSALTASNGLDFVGGTNIVSFAVGESNQLFFVPIINDILVEGDETVALQLASATGSSSLGLNTNAVLTIQDEDFYGQLSFASTNYFVNESGVFAAINVVRTNGSAGDVSVNFSAVSGTATAGLDFTPTNGVLFFPDGVTNVSFAVAVSEDSLVEGDETVLLSLSNPSGGAALGSQSTSVLTITENDFFGSFAFQTNAFTVTEGPGAVATITVLRLGGTAGSVSVNFSAVAGSATVGSDFTLTNGILTFADGQASRTFDVLIFNDGTGENNETVLLSLANAQNGASLGSPINAVLTIVDDDSSVAFSSTTFAANEASGTATIIVNRLGVTNNSLSVAYYLTNGTATPGLDYTNVSGVLGWAPGDATPKSFTVPIINDALVEGDETVNAVLINPSGTTLADPFVTTLTIVDNDVSPYIVGAGAVMLAESFPPGNGIIESNETVTLSLALRNISTTNSANLVATLLAINGVVAPSPVTNNYGALLAGGPSVARAFAFTANATNGSVVTAVLQLQDGAVNLGAVPFVFRVGARTTKFANTNTITIADNSPATPYPSIINVSGLPGAVSKVTVTISNLTHTFPGDIDMLLVSPNGQKVMLMSDAGSESGTVPNPISNVTLGFDDAAPTSLTTNQIVSGVFKPTNLSIDGPDFFPSPGPGAGPFGSLLSAFNGVSPNGAWSLYVRDDNNVDSGVLLGGWCINFIEGTLVNPGGDLAVTMTDAPDPAYAGQTITYSITVTNAGGNVADNVVLTNTLPAGLTYAALSNAFGTTFQSGNTAIIQLGSIAVGGAKTVTVVANALSAGSYTNRAAVTSTLTDGVAGNNTATAVTTVIVASDLSVSIVDSPDAVVVSNLLKYTITVVNNGPSPAAGVVLTNFLPSSVTFVSATNPLGGIANASGVVTANLGTLANGASGVVTIVGRPTMVGQVTDTASVGSTITELNSTNNTVSAKTVVVAGPTLLQLRSGGSFLFSWPSEANNFVLQCATNLASPVAWTTVTNLPVDGGGTRTVTVPIDPAVPVKVFRLFQAP